MYFYQLCVLVMSLDWWAYRRTPVIVLVLWAPAVGVRVRTEGGTPRSPAGGRRRQGSSEEEEEETKVCVNDRHVLLHVVDPSSWFLSSQEHNRRCWTKMNVIFLFVKTRLCCHAFVFPLTAASCRDGVSRLRCLGGSGSTSGVQPDSWYHTGVRSEWISGGRCTKI